MNPDLIAQQLGLQQIPPKRAQRPAAEKSQRPPDSPEKQLDPCPGKQHDTRSEHRQRVDQRRDGGERQRAANAQQGKEHQQLHKGHGGEDQLCAQPAAEIGPHIAEQLPRPAAKPLGQLGAEKGEHGGKGRREKIGAEEKGHGKKKNPRAVLRHACAQGEKPGRQRAGQGAQRVLG